MKDTVITARRKRRELCIILSCYVLANIFNVWGIVKYHTPWTELLTAQIWVLAVTGFFYALVWIGRGLWLLFRFVLKRPGN